MDGQQWIQRLAIVGLLGMVGCKSNTSLTSGMPNPPQLSQSKLSLFKSSPPPQPNEIPVARKKGPLSADTVAAVTDAHVDAAFNNEELSAVERNRTLDAARQMYEKTLQREPTNYNALRGLARLYTRIGDREQAMRVYQKLVETYPSDHKAHYEHSLSLARFEDWVGSEAACRKAMEIDPSSLRYPRTLGICLARQGRFEDGLNMMASVLSEAEARTALAKVFADMGQMEAARLQLDVALKADPKCVSAQEALAQLSGGSTGPLSVNPEGVQQVQYREMPSR